MNENKAALQILRVLKELQGTFLNQRDLARRAGFKGAHIKEFKKGFKLLEQQGIVKLYHSGWASEGFHRAIVILSADIYVIEDLEKELDNSEKVDTEVSSEMEVQDFILVPVLTPLGERSYISRTAFKQNHAGNFWRPIPNRKY